MLRKQIKILSIKTKISKKLIEYIYFWNKSSQKLSKKKKII